MTATRLNRKTKQLDRQKDALLIARKYPGSRPASALCDVDDPLSANLDITAVEMGG